MNEIEKTKKLQIKEILENLSVQDLRLFILQYARKDNNFEIAFKSHFLSRINLGDEGIKYRRVLGELIKPKTVKNPKIGSTQVKTILFVLNDFTKQMQDCLGTENYTEAFYIAVQSLEKIAYLQNRFHIKNKAIESARIQFLNGVDVLLKQDLAPKFRGEMENQFKSIVYKSYFIPSDHNLISVLDDNEVLVHSEKKVIMAELIEKLKKETDRHSLLKIMIRLSYPFDDLASEIIKRFSEVDIFKALKSLIQESNFKSVEFFLFDTNVGFDYHSEMLKLYLSMSKNEHTEISKRFNALNFESISPLELQYMTNGLEYTYLRKEFANIKKRVDTLPFGTKAKIYANAQNFDGLIQLLKDKNEFEWVKVYDKLLIDSGYRAELGDLYTSIIYAYLENHIGKNARTYAEKFAQRLKQLKMEDILDKIFSELSTDFEHRKTLKTIIQQ